MANSLDRNLKVGDSVVMNGGEVATIDCETFGCFSSLSGTALGIKFNGESIRANGYDINAEATMQRFAAINGWKNE